MDNYCPPNEWQIRVKLWKRKPDVKLEMSMQKDMISVSHKEMNEFLAIYGKILTSDNRIIDIGSYPHHR